MKLAPPCPRCGSTENPDNDRDASDCPYESCYECFIRDVDEHQQAMQDRERDTLSHAARTAFGIGSDS